MRTEPHNDSTSSVVTDKIRNIDALLDIGDQESRRIVLTIADQVLRRLDAYERITSIMKLVGDILTI